MRELQTNFTQLSLKQLFMWKSKLITANIKPPTKKAKLTNPNPTLVLNLPRNLNVPTACNGNAASAFAKSLNTTTKQKNASQPLILTALGTPPKLNIPTIPSAFVKSAAAPTYTITKVNIATTPSAFPKHMTTQPKRVSVKAPTTSIVAMEWEDGEIYLGILDNNGDNAIVRNCLRSVAKFDTGVLKMQKKFKPNTFVINFHDNQKNPDMDFCAWQLPVVGSLISLSTDKKSLLVPNMLDFTEELRKRLECYLE